MSFDFIAPIYDRLARAVFGKALSLAQVYYLRQIKPESRVLIPGGGTGWILTQLPAHCKEVVYVEPSLNMIEKARKQPAKFPVTFVHARMEQTMLTGNFDVVIANFFFDLFSGQELENMIKRVTGCLSGSGLLLVSEFQNTRVWWQRIMLAMMYRFFRIVAGLQNRVLADWKNALIEFGFTPVAEATFLKGFIVTTVFTKE
jgi:2-polyprenyl-3-methyl-5-hydroxy-6-metoxy-1,4-benzoquinol methylase